MESRESSMLLEKKTDLLKTIIVFITYIFYTKLLGELLIFIGIKDSTIIYFVSDFIYLMFITVLYRNTIKKDYIEYKNKKLSKSLFKSFGISIILFVIYFIIGIIFSSISKEYGSFDSNTKEIYSLASISTIYIFFKTLFFATLAEELVFKKAIKDVINNKAFFLIISSFIYSFMNIIYADLGDIVTWMHFTPYFIYSILLGSVYIKNNNIIEIIIIKFFYNLIPLTFLIIGLGVK